MARSGAFALMRNDSGTPVSAARFIHERIASSSLRVFPEAAHFLNIEQSELFNRTLTEFLSQVKGGAGDRQP